MLIKKISLKSSRNPNIFIVEIDGEKYILHSEIIVKYGLSTNSEIEQDRLSEVMFESDVMIATNLAMNYVSSKIITAKQLKDYLRNKGYKTNVITKVVDKFNEYGVLNDENFASAYVNIKQNSLSKRAIEQKLIQKGVNKDIASSCLEDFDDTQVAIKTAEKFMKNKECTEENITKLMRHLSYKGFDYETISKVLNNLKNNDE
ncbi:MAG: RecX family transcriptional regulator [Clostridia bacterium]|nr:RecX family transcriptional regulator [Clostridia bacterium]